MKIQNNEAGTKQLKTLINATKEAPEGTELKTTDSIVSHIRQLSGIHNVDERVKASQSYTYNVAWDEERQGYKVTYYNTDVIAGTVLAWQLEI